MINYCTGILVVTSFYGLGFELINILGKPIGSKKRELCYIFFHTVECGICLGLGIRIYGEPL